MDRFLGLLQARRSVLIFPEGGRQPGPDLGPSRPGVGYLALQSGCSVVPVYINGTASLKASLLRRPPLTVRYGRPIRLDPECLERYRNPDGYRDFGDVVVAAIQALKDEVEGE
jgi:1-acyl-sn-glycerol-3-phosphate acyltransferase